MHDIEWWTLHVEAVADVQTLDLAGVTSAMLSKFGTNIAYTKCSQKWVYDLMHKYNVMYHSVSPQLWWRPLYTGRIPKLVPNCKSS